MNITEPFVLKRDVILTPCAELLEDVRRRITCDEGDFTLTTRRSRAPVQVIDAGTAALLALFREPRTIADAVVENGRALGKSPADWFDELLPHLMKLVSDRVLVPAGNEEEQEVLPRYESDTAIAGWTIVRCASLVEDTEIYEVRKGGDTAALKIARFASRPLRALFENEIAVLRHLDGIVAPRLIAEGIHDERPYAIMEWVPGTEAGVAAAQRRHDRASVIELCASIAAAYAELHARGVAHGDVHARNVIAGPDRVTLIDFGYAHVAGEPWRTGRAGVRYFQEPEHFTSNGPPTPAGEQYALAALLYHLITGNHYLDFRYEREDMARQIRTDPPLPFAERGIPPWPEVERILFRALEKDPARRHASVAEMAALLAGAHRTAVRESLQTPVSAEAQAFFERTLGAFARGGRLFVQGLPNASIALGSAGAAAGLLRIAETRGDAALLALADVWRSRAAALVGTESAFLDDQRGVTRARVGEITPFYNESGVHAAGALVAAAMGADATRRRAIESFLAASKKPCSNLDLTLGRSASLLAAAMLLATGDAPGLRAFGAETMSAIWDELDLDPPLDALPEDAYLGIAHGWAGYLYAGLRWCAASGDSLPARLTRRLDELAALRIARGRGAYWPISPGKPENFMSGWCGGSAGVVFLFTLAHRFFDDERWLRLAELAAWTTWDQPSPSGHLCCGSSGRAYALLNFYRHTGERAWLGRARQLANHAAAAGTTGYYSDSLVNGDLGVAVLIADLASPENARMPFFE